MNQRVRLLQGQRAITIFLGAIFILALLAACSGPSDSATKASTVAAAATTAPTATTTAPATTTPTASSTAAPSPTATATSTEPPTATPTAAAVEPATATSTPKTNGGTDEVMYFDDRSSAVELIDSYYSAINRKEYARAYSYWEPESPADQLPPFAQFAQGYATTTSVQVKMGAVEGGVGAGQIYFSVPVVIQSQSTDDGAQTFSGCFTLHISRPAIQSEPPFHPLAIQNANIELVPPGQDADATLKQPCTSDNSGQVPELGTPSTDPNDISAQRYLDNRTTGADVLRSYYNAINRKEYARAYDYWEPNTPAAELPPFANFQSGYADTASVVLTLGTPQTGAAAGNLYTSVPATVVATMTDGSTQTFVGCYTTHLGQPANQTEPPFQPWAIQKANVQKVANNADTTALMANACQP